MGKKEASRAGKRRGRKPVKEITPPQRRTLSTILAMTGLKGYPPTLQELAAELGISTTGVNAQIKHLIRKGYVRREARRARSLEVIVAPKDDPTALFPVRIVGDVAAGIPSLEARDEDIGEVLVEAHILRGGECFAVRVKGDSMKGAAIHDGDLCIVRKQPVAESGDIVAAVKGDKGVVKRLRISGGTIELLSENPKYKPIPVLPGDDFRIAGKVVAVRREPSRGIGGA